MRTPITTDYTWRTGVSTSYNSRRDVSYLMTQDLDFLMTEDDNYIVLQDSYSDFIQFITRATITTNYI